MPEELAKHLFLSFVKKQEPLQTPLAGKSALGKECHVKDVALGASQTVCAPVVLQAAEPPPDNNSSNNKDKDKHHGLAEKLHGLSEKIHSLGHIRHDSSGGDSGRRSRAGTFTCTRMRTACHHPNFSANNFMERSGNQYVLYELLLIMHL